MIKIFCLIIRENYAVVFTPANCGAVQKFYFYLEDVLEATYAKLVVALWDFKHGSKNVGWVYCGEVYDCFTRIPSVDNNKTTFLVG